MVQKTLSEMENYTGTIVINNKPITWQTTFSTDVKFKCSQCGLCCMATNVELHKDDLIMLQQITDKDFAQKFVNPLTKQQSVRIKDTDEKDCMFLEDNKCTVYSNRPHSCRLFPFKIVFYDEKTVFIDVVYGCKSISNKQFSQTNEVDFSKMVGNELIWIQKLGLVANASDQIKEPLLKYQQQFQYSKNIVLKIFKKLNELNNLNELYFLLSGVQAIYLKLQEKVDESTLFDYGMEFFNAFKAQVDFNNSEIDPFLKSVFFKSYDNTRKLRYKVTLHNSIDFDYVDGSKVSYTYDKLEKIPIAMDHDVKNELAGYLMNILQRKTTELDFYRELADKNIDAIAVYLEIYKKVINHLKTLILISAVKNEDNKQIIIDNIREAIMMYDNIALHAPSIFMPSIIK